MVLVEGIKVKAKRLPKKQLILAWKTLSNQPFPNIKALILNDGDFNKVMHHKRCLEDSLREIEEWGKVLSIEGTDACVFNADDAADKKYIVLIREKPYNSLEDIILHELSHIAKGDL